MRKQSYLNKYSIKEIDYKVAIQTAGIGIQ